MSRPNMTPDDLASNPAFARAIAKFRALFNAKWAEVSDQPDRHHAEAQQDDFVYGYVKSIDVATKLAHDLPLSVIVSPYRHATSENAPLSEQPYANPVGLRAMAGLLSRVQRSARMTTVNLLICDASARTTSPATQQKFSADWPALSSAMLDSAPFDEDLRNEGDFTEEEIAAIFQCLTFLKKTANSDEIVESAVDTEREYIQRLGEVISEAGVAGFVELNLLPWRSLEQRYLESGGDHYAWLGEMQAALLEDNLRFRNLVKSAISHVAHQQRNQAALFDSPVAMVLASMLYLAEERFVFEQSPNLIYEGVVPPFFRDIVLQARLGTAASVSDRVYLKFTSDCEKGKYQGVTSTDDFTHSSAPSSPPTQPLGGPANIDNLGGLRDPEVMYTSAERILAKRSAYACFLLNDTVYYSHVMTADDREIMSAVLDTYHSGVITVPLNLDNGGKGRLKADIQEYLASRSPASDGSPHAPVTPSGVRGKRGGSLGGVNDDAAAVAANQPKVQPPVRLPDSFKPPALRGDARKPKPKPKPQEAEAAAQLVACPATVFGGQPTTPESSSPPLQVGGGTKFGFHATE